VAGRTSGPDTLSQFRRQGGNRGRRCGLGCSPGCCRTSSTRSRRAGRHRRANALESMLGSLLSGLSAGPSRRPGHPRAGGARGVRRRRAVPAVPVPHGLDRHVREEWVPVPRPDPGARPEVIVPGHDPLCGSKGSARCGPISNMCATWRRRSGSRRSSDEVPSRFRVVHQTAHRILSTCALHEWIDRPQPGLARSRGRQARSLARVAWRGPVQSCEVARTAATAALREWQTLLDERSIDQIVRLLRSDDEICAANAPVESLRPES